MTKRYTYRGDGNPECGGYLVNTSGAQWGYAEVTRITPCSDAGGPDNCFWVENLTVNLREGAALDSVLSTCGQDVESLPKQPAQRLAVVIDCHVAYGAYDKESGALVRIGKPDPFHRDSEAREWQPEVQLRGNASILRYARSVAE